MVDEAARLGHDRLADAAHVLDPVEPGAEVLDRPEPGRQVDRRLVQPRVLDRDRHLVAEGGRQLELLGRPLAPGLVVEHEQPEKPLTEDDRHEADRLDPVARVDLAQLGRRCGPAGVLDDPEFPVAGRLDPVGRRVHGQGGDGLAKRRAQPSVGGEPERMGVLVDQPERRALDREERDGVVDDVVEQRRQVGPGGDGRRDPTERPVAGDVDPRLAWGGRGGGPPASLAGASFAVASVRDGHLPAEPPWLDRRGREEPSPERRSSGAVGRPYRDRALPAMTRQS